MIKSQITYCPLVLTFCQRQSNKLINKVHERAIRLIYQDNSNFKVLLKKQRNLQVLMNVIYKILNDIAPPIMKSLFQFRINQYKRNTVIYGLEILTYRVPAIQTKLSPKYVHVTSLDEFKPKIKSWKCEICPCRLCKNYKPNLGYIN